MSKDTCLPEETITVNVGTGIVDCNIAYQLSELGRNDDGVIDPGPMPTTGGSSKHASGIMFQADEPKILSRFAQFSRRLDSDLEGEVEKQAYNQVGGIESQGSKTGWITFSLALDKQNLGNSQVRTFFPKRSPRKASIGRYRPDQGRLLFKMFMCGEL